jgi:hypothetical protein
VLNFTYTSLGYAQQIAGHGGVAYWTANARDAELGMIQQTSRNGAGARPSAVRAHLSVRTAPPRPERGGAPSQSRDYAERRQSDLEPHEPGRQALLFEECLAQAAGAARGSSATL